MQKIDYSVLNGGSAEPDANFDKRWWAVPVAERAHNVAKIVKMIADDDSRRHLQYQISTRLYGNTNLMGLNGLSMSRLSGIQNAIKDRVTYNVIQAAIDTVVSKMAKNKPRPLFLTSGGDWKMQRKAKKLDKFVDGIFYENYAYALGNFAFRDSCIFGDGILHVFALHGRVRFERVIPSELYVDAVDSFYGEPRQLHRAKNVDRLVLIDLFPDKKDEIMRATPASAQMVGEVQNVSDQVTVIESWHLPSGPDAKDGLHTINLENDNLFEEKWKKDYFPFAKLPWSRRMFGYWSQSLAEQIQNIQLEINKLLWVIQRAMHLAGAFKVWLKTGSKIVKEHVNNDIGTIIEGEEAPQYLVPPIVAPEIYAHLQTLKNQAFEQSGVSQLSATSQKPSGLDSGKALREYNNIETERFMSIGQAYEQFYLDLAKLSVDCAKDIYEAEGAYDVKVPGKKFIETIDWKEINLEDDSYIMKCFPVSSLPNEPAGRLQTVQEYVQAGFIDPMTAKKLLDFPDLEQVETLGNAQDDWITQVLEEILENGDFTPPEPEMDLQLAKTLCLQFIAYAHTTGVGPERMELLRTFNTQLDLLIQKALPPPPPAPAMPGADMGAAGPQAVPMAPPQSDMLPNVPLGVGA